jgi:GNAT superfamily N-acetyltransferase
VLRAGDPAADVHFPQDDAEGAFHLGVHDGPDLVAVASFSPDGTGGFQLRGMAVAPEHQGQGLGAALLAEGVERCRAAGGTRLWANARRPVVVYYLQMGMEPKGDEFVTADTGLPHRRVEIEL